MSKGRRLFWGEIRKVSVLEPEKVLLFVLRGGIGM